MPHIPEAFRHPASVTTHQVDDHDAPGGSNLEAQLLRQDERVPASSVHPAGYLEEVDGFRFPHATLAPPPAEVYRREPFTAPEISLEIPPDSSLHNTDNVDRVRIGEAALGAPAPDQHGQLGYALLNFPVQLNATAPVLVLPMELGAINGGIRRSVTVLNNGTVGVLLAGSLEGCTAAFGFPLAAGATVSLNEGVSGALWALAASGTPELRLLIEQGPAADRAQQPELAEICRLLRKMAGER